MTVERGLISRMIWRPEDLLLALDQNIHPYHFHEEELRKVWQFIIDHFDEYGSGPDKEALLLEFGTFRFQKPANSTQYYLDQLVDDHRQARTREMLKEAIDLVQGSEGEKGDHEAALQVLQVGLLDIEQETSLTEDSSTADLSAALQRFHDIQEKGDAMTGISSGFPFIDKVTGGFQVEQFILIAGPQKSGKSSILLKMAKAAQAAEKKALFFSFEMSNEEQEDRYISLSAGVSLFNLTHGKMTPKDWTAVEDAREESEARVAPIQWVHDMRRMTTLAGLEAKVIKYAPDVVFVDGLYLMDAEVPDKTSTDWESLTVISRGMKRMAQNRHIVVVGSTQALESKMSKKQGITTYSIGFTSSFGQDADLLIGLEHAGEDKHAVMRIMDARHAARQSTTIYFDWSTGTIEEDAAGWTDQGDDDDID